MSLILSFRRSLLYPRRPGYYCSSIDRHYDTISSKPPQPSCANNTTQPIISRIYYIESKQLRHLQSLANNNNTKQKRSKIEDFSVCLWKLVADDTSENKIYKMGIVVDGRSKLCGKIDNPLFTYFGIILSIPFGEDRSIELRERTLNWIADVIHDFLEVGTTKEHFLGLIDWVEAHRPHQMLARINSDEGVKEDMGPAIVVSSGQRFPMEKVDFGFGTPTLGSYHFPWGGDARYVMPMPSPLKNSGWVVYMHLLESHLDLIETKASDVFRPITCDYLEI